MATQSNGIDINGQFFSGGVQQLLGPGTQFGQYPGQQNISQIQHTGDFRDIRPSLPSTRPPPLNMQPKLPGGGIGSLFPQQPMLPPQQNPNQEIMNAVNNIPSQVTEGVGSLFDSVKKHVVTRGGGMPFNNELYASPAATVSSGPGANLNNLLTAGADQTGNNSAVNPNMINQNPYGNSSGM